MLENDEASLPMQAELPTMPQFDDVLGEFMRQHPELAWMTQLIAAQRKPPEDDGDPGVDPRDDELDTLRATLDRTRARANRLAEVARRLATDLEAAQARLSDLAAAAGACGLCWGEDPNCRACRGLGKPRHFDTAASRIPTPSDPQ
ncbi:hypothetical protein [Lysobacter terrae]